MEEQAARRVMLARAIEVADVEGKLLGAVEREQIDRDSRRAATAVDATGWARHMPPGEFLHERARRVLATVQTRNPGLVALQEARPWQRWLAMGTPILALLAGVASNIAVNPHRLDLVSLPLIGIVAWNVAMYAVLIAEWVMAQRGHRPWLAGLGRWTDGERALRRRPGSLRMQVAAQFWREWFGATQSLHVSRLKRVLHLSAALWAVGVIASLLVRGLAVEYRVGWESTFLDANQVNALLNVLRVPAQLLFPMEPFTVLEVTKLRFSDAGGAAAGGSRWVFMYVALLTVVVVVPRLVLAALAWLRERGLSRSVALAAGGGYYQRVMELLDMARVLLCVVTHSRQDHAALMRILVQEPDVTRTLASSDQGDVLQFVDLSGKQPPDRTDEVGERSGPLAWLAARMGRREPTGVPAASDPALAEAREQGDVVLHLARDERDIEAARPLLEWLGKPVLVIGNEGLPLDAFARNWTRETNLFEAIGSLLPRAGAAACERLAKAWDQRNRARFGRAMDIIAEHLMFAARQSQEVHESGFPALRQAERQAREGAREAAMESIVNSLDESARTMLSRLRQLHRVDEADESALQHHLERGQLVQRRLGEGTHGAVAETAGGAAVGAGVGFAVDLLAGGLMLGAATAVGAAVGGWVAAAWTRRGTAIQLSDEMMQALVEAALLRYLAVVHHGRLAPGVDPASSWASEVVAQVAADSDMFIPYWTASRTQPHAARMASALGRQLESTTLKVLGSVQEGS